VPRRQVGPVVIVDVKIREASLQHKAPTFRINRQCAMVVIAGDSISPKTSVSVVVVQS